MIEEFDRAEANVPSYRALSCVWGIGTTRKAIVLNGRPAYVTVNLYNALYHLRKIFPHTYLWIDALCIDQNNSGERSHQVAQMKATFSEAKEVISWLGPKHDEVDRLFSFIQDHHHKPCDRGLPIEDNSSEDFEDTGVYSTSVRGCLHMDHSLMDAVHFIEEQSYWDRAWIIQEIIVAKSVKLMCGQDIIPWLHFTALLRLLSGEHFSYDPGYHHRTKTACSRRSTILRLDSWRHIQPDLAQALHWSALSLATDARDKVFALLGLVTQGSGRDIVADYSCSPCTVFCQALSSMVDDWNKYLAEFDLEKGTANTYTRLVHSEIDRVNEHIKSRSCFLLDQTNLYGHGSPDLCFTDIFSCDGTDCGSRDLVWKFARWHKLPLPKGVIRQQFMARTRGMVEEKEVKSPTYEDEVESWETNQSHRRFSQYSLASSFCDTLSWRLGPPNALFTLLFSATVTASLSACISGPTEYLQTHRNIDIA
jgi:hypothetical protein